MRGAERLGKIYILKQFQNKDFHNRDYCRKPLFLQQKVKRVNIKVLHRLSKDHFQGKDHYFPNGC